ncbi:MAG: glycoside hydrolase family 2 [Verrucomicrobiota bacterium]
MKTRHLFLSAVLGLASVLPVRAAEQWIGLEGSWQFTLDSGRHDAVWARTNVTDTITLPGTTDLAGKGPENTAREPDRLTRVHPYYGQAWYQREFTVPADWKGRNLFLILERTKKSSLWLDGAPIGSQDSLVASHVYALGSPAPGTHTLTLCIDNSQRPPVGDPHQLSDQTQTDWNGVIGRIGLRVVDPVWIEDVQVYPDLVTRQVRVLVEVGNSTGARRAVTVDARARVVQGKGSALQPAFKLSAIETNRAVVEVDLDLEHPVKWDEFSPGLYELEVSLRTDQNFSSSRKVVFGIRALDARGTQLKINGNTTFLRGRHDACVFPLTGFPPMDVEGWRRALGIAKSYGLNLVRFHTWCPPDAAFTAADELGMYLQPELPNWRDFGDKAHDDFLRAEGERLLRQFGNHPSFIMLALGNELGGHQDLMAPQVAHFKSIDRRHLYAQGSNNWFGNPGEGDDYYCSFQVAWRKIRGSYATVDQPGMIQTGPANSLRDYSSEIEPLHIPVLSHEVGQYQVSPDFREIDRYTGVLRARNLELFRDRFRTNHLLDQSDAFMRASGALSALCYKEEIEAALRTPGFGGFHLLDLMDFPGQGTALVGMLNAFMESKGILEPPQWREFCCETVPLLRLSSYVWTDADTLTAQAQVAHYGAKSLEVEPRWTLSDAGGKLKAEGRLPRRTLPQGALKSLGELQIPLKGLPVPGHFTLELSFPGTAFRNHYSIWVYPAAPDTAPGQVFVARSIDEARARLQEGGSVLLMPEPQSLSNSIPGYFTPDFWNYAMFEKSARERKVAVAPGTLGILCDPASPAFAGFPTESHGDWQWFRLLMNSHALVLDSLPPGFRPLLQVIDNCDRAHRLGSILEAQVGPGKLLLCAIDLPSLQQNPEGRQLLSSLLHYMNSPQFQPATRLTADQVEGLLP